MSNLLRLFFRNPMWGVGWWWYTNILLVVTMGRVCNIDSRVGIWSTSSRSTMVLFVTLSSYIVGTLCSIFKLASIFYMSLFVTKSMHCRSFWSILASFLHSKFNGKSVKYDMFLHLFHRMCKLKDIGLLASPCCF